MVYRLICGASAQIDLGIAAVIHTPELSSQTYPNSGNCCLPICSIKLNLEKALNQYDRTNSTAKTSNESRLVISLRNSKLGHEVAYTI